LEYQKSRALQEHGVREPPKEGIEDTDAVCEPIRTVLSENLTSTESFLVSRIAQANTRQQFAYWRNHREKLVLHTRASISTQGPLPAAESPFRVTLDRNPSSSTGTLLQDMLKPVVPSVMTATNLNPARLEFTGTKSVISVSEYETSTWQPARDVVDFPPAPKDKDGEKVFEYPYCFVIRPRGRLADKAWKYATPLTTSAGQAET
jgi:hypothetical protein